MYIDASLEGMRQGKDAGVIDKQKSPCCEGASTFSASPVKASGCGCCTTVKNMGQNLDLSDMVAELGQIDLNEWVGECR